MAITDLAFGNQKVDLHTAGCVIAGGIIVKIKLVSARRQHLSDDVFYNKAFVDFQFVEEQLFVALFTDNPVYQTSG